MKKKLEEQLIALLDSRKIKYTETLPKTKSGKIDWMHIETIARFFDVSTTIKDEIDSAERQYQELIQERKRIDFVDLR